MSAVPRVSDSARLEPAPRQVTGRVRLGRRTKLLVKRLTRGDIAVIDH
jgi:uncharacterized membrane-anchored protein